MVKDREIRSDCRYCKPRTLTFAHSLEQGFAYEFLKTFSREGFLMPSLLMEEGIYVF